MQLVSRYFLLLAAPLLLTAGLKAQAPATASRPGHQEVDLAVTYTAQHSNLVSTPTFWQQGGGIELSTPKIFPYENILFSYGIFFNLYKIIIIIIFIG